jgi:23S rRNA (adenine2503-C2)-methyltransferase
MDLQLLEKTLADRGEPAFRARQVWAWTAGGASGYEQMTDLPSALRETLARELPFSSLTTQRESHARDGTVKALFATADGRPLEAVLMRYRDGRRSLCVSSQSGCPLTCTFCATGAMRFARNLSASEIVDQALHFRRIEPIDHCVFMGMGEPMLNLENVLAACERLPDLGVTHRRTTISTVGWIPGIERLAEQDMPVRLALSVHAAEESLRSALMPVNDRFPLREVIEACRGFYARRRRRVFVEYVMLAGVNDRYEQALSLARVLSSPREGEPSIFKVNLIPYNPTAVDGRERYEGSTRESIAAFRDALLARGVPATIRLTRGRDIDAACGQLATGLSPTTRPLADLQSVGRRNRVLADEQAAGRSSIGGPAPLADRSDTALAG